MVVARPGDAHRVVVGWTPCRNRAPPIGFADIGRTTLLGPFLRRVDGADEGREPDLDTAAAGCPWLAV